MYKSLIALSLLVGLSTGVAVAAPVDQVTTSQQVAEQPQGTVTEDDALKAYTNNTNPDVSVPTTGPYDERDRYTGPNGFELPGYGRLPPS